MYVVYNKYANSERGVILWCAAIRFTEKKGVPNMEANWFFYPFTDVDTNEPDEKSMITYLSSLYDVFPNPPHMHPLFDIESQRRVQEYRELAQQLLYWCKEKTILLQERTFPPTLIELKRLLNDLNRFRTEEVPPRLRDKQKLFSIFKDVEVIFFYLYHNFS
jgi:hypothetical protein